MKKVLSILVVFVLMCSVQSFASLSVAVAPPTIYNYTDAVMPWSQTFTMYGTVDDIAGIRGDVAVSVLALGNNEAGLGSLNSMPIFTAYIDGVAVGTLLDDDYSLTAPFPPGVNSDTDTFGWEPYSGSVLTKIQVEVVLTVSPHSSATIIGDFEVMPVPEPATMSLLALGGLLLRKRK